MKNKILTKVILIVVSICTLVVTFVVPSFAYTVSEPSTDNPGVNWTSIYTPYINMEVDFYANGSKKTSCRFPLFTNSNSSTDSRVFVQVPDSGEYGQLIGYADTAQTDIFETGEIDLFLLRQSIHSYITPNYSAGGVDFDYHIKSINNRSLYYVGDISGMNYSTFIYLDDTYQEGDVINFTRLVSYITNTGVASGSQQHSSTNVVYDENGYKGIYIYYYDTDIIQPDWLVVDSSISFDSPIVIDDFGYGGERGFIRTTSRFLCTDDYYSVVHDFLVNSDLNNYQIGYQDGFSSGETFGYETGHADGLETGFNNGYSVGYEEGFVDGGNGVVTNPFDFIIDSVSTLINWEFIPGLSFGLIFSVFVGAVILIVFLKLMAGG